MSSLKYYIISMSLVVLSFCSSKSEEGDERLPSSYQLKSIMFIPNEDDLIRNPGMGWMLYDDANDEVANASTYWNNQDETANKYASCFYIRWRWSDMEPEEGKYAWLYDDNFKALIKGAQDRGLKLAFRIYVNGQDNIKPGTPEFVFDAGAESYLVDKLGGGTNRTPYADDPVFQEKLGNFIQAFASEFDDPEIVDFIDGFNLGWWGEGHHLKFKNVLNKQNTFSWIINLYGNAFNKVPLAITINSEMGYELEKLVAIEGQGYITRRDGLGSKWYTDYEKEIVRNLFPNNTFIAEAAYWGDASISHVSSIDSKYNWATWNDYYKQVVDEALNSRANYLDLREYVEANRYVTQALDQVKRFMTLGGYRLYPKEILYTESLDKTQKLKVAHTWENIGAGIFPNTNMRWNLKYKLAFGVVDQNNTLKKTWISESSEPSTWVKGKTYKYEEAFDVSGLDTGSFKLVCAIIDTTQNNTPSINLAVDSKLVMDNGWLVIGDVTID